MPRPPLTEQQKRAVTSRHSRLFIEANPGSGKTAVAAERFGVLRFDGGTDPRAIAAVSFTRSATTELDRRIRRRWGSDATGWPHGVMTIDALLCSVVRHLLRTGLIHWIGGHTTLEVLDDWRGHNGYRWLSVPNYRRIATLDTTATVTSIGRRVTEARFGFGNKDQFHGHLALGRCTHDDVRAVLAAALRIPAVKDTVTEFLRGSVAHIVVDEVFDANRLDLALVTLACDAGVSVTLVGDPWQALYGFRGAKPDLVPEVIMGWGFEALPLSQSFRFESDSMRTLSTSLRASESVSVAVGETHDVVLASTWDALWNGPNYVLPMSFGRTTNKTDAAAIVLLDHLIHSRFSARAVFLPEALILLDLDADVYRCDGPAALGGVVDILSSGSVDASNRALAELRGVVKELGAPRRPPSGRADAEQRQLDRLTALAARLTAGRSLVPGMTIHQAKGREWNHVGVRLTPTEHGRLAQGLDPDVEADRALYVALTRARHSVTAVG